VSNTLILTKFFKMKKITILLVICILAVAACKKSDNTTTPDPVYPAGMHAKINGNTWTPEYVNKVTSSGGGHYSIQIDGTDSATHETISILLPDFSGRGVHNLSATSYDKAYYSLDTGSFTAPVQVNATSGQINVTSINDTSVGGTFYFTAGSKTITEGTFNVSF
jgi:hypothetical protein